MTDLSINSENKIKKVLFNEVSFAVAIIGAVIAVSAYFNAPSLQNAKDIEELKKQTAVSEALSKQLTNIKDNDLHVIQLDLKENKEVLNQIQKDLVRLETILNERLPTKK